MIRIDSINKKAIVYLALNPSANFYQASNPYPKSFFEGYDQLHMFGKNAYAAIENQTELSVKDLKTALININQIVGIIQPVHYQLLVHLVHLANNIDTSLREINESIDDININLIELFLQDKAKPSLSTTEFAFHQLSADDAQSIIKQFAQALSNDLRYLRQHSYLDSLTYFGNPEIDKLDRVFDCYTLVQGETATSDEYQIRLLKTIDEAPQPIAEHAENALEFVRSDESMNASNGQNYVYDVQTNAMITKVDFTKRLKQVEKVVNALLTHPAMIEDIIHLKNEFDHGDIVKSPVSVAHFMMDNTENDISIEQFYQRLMHVNQTIQLINQVVNAS